MDKLLKELKAFYKKEGRGHLPWRKTKDPYKILVSEIMLQQTQVERVIPFYKNFIKQFPTAAALSKAPLPKVLAAWQGLGYNRRAKFLHEAAKQLSKAKPPRSGAKEFFSSSPYAQKNSFAPGLSGLLGTQKNSCVLPLSVEFLESLPGVGHYTARAVSVFAYNRPEVFVETNIRTVFFHSHILQNIGIVSDKELLPLVEEALKKSRMQPRDFYAALMDYGSHLKAIGVRLNNKSKHYTKQSAFEGSARQLRGAIIKQLLVKKATIAACAKIVGRPVSEVRQEVQKLLKEKLIQKKGTYYSIAE